MAEPAPAGPAPLRRMLSRQPAERLRGRQWRRYWIYDPLLGALDIALLFLCRRLPIAWSSAIGGVLGVLNARYRFHIVRERARQGYAALSGGHPSAAETDRAVMRLFNNIGRVMVEFSVLDRLWRSGRVTVAGAEHLHAACAGGKPVLVMGLHLGNWEALAPTIIGLLPGVKLAGFYQPPRSRFQHKLAIAARVRFGATLLPPGVAGARMARRHLVDERGLLLIYADEARRGRVSAPLFGRPLPRRANLLAVVRLAWASGVQPIPIYAERLAGARFRVTFLPPVPLLAEGDDPRAALVENAHRLDRLITPLVLARLDQWYMLVDYYRP